MSIVPVSRLSHAELALLGNNLSPPRRKRSPVLQLQAVNRSLATFGEQVDRLEKPVTMPKRPRPLPA